MEKKTKWVATLPGRITQMTAGTLMMSVGIYFFKIPNGFSTGGVSGIGTILGKLLPFLSAASWIAILNVAMLILGFILLGKETGAFTVYCSLLMSGATWLLERLVPLSAPLTDDPMLELIYAMMLTGIGSALVFHSGSTTGGTDITAMILRKYSKIDTGKALLLCDAIVACSAIFVFGIKIGMYSVLGLFFKAFLVDGVIEAIDSCKCFMIVTDKPDDMVEFITKELGHTATLEKAEGAFTHSEKTVIHTVCRRIEGIRLRVKVKEIDPHAFMIVTTSSEIIGRGFRGV